MGDHGGGISSPDTSELNRSGALIAEEDRTLRADENTGAAKPGTRVDPIESEEVRRRSCFLAPHKYLS